MVPLPMTADDMDNLLRCIAAMTSTAEAEARGHLRAVKRPVLYGAVLSQLERIAAAGIERLPASEPRPVGVWPLQSPTEFAR